jgi:hypothetical protein
MVKPSNPRSWQGGKRDRTRQTFLPAQSVNRTSNPVCAPGRHAFGVPESTVWHKGKRLNFYTCALCTTTVTCEPGQTP